MAYSFTFTSGRRAHGFNYTIAVPDGFNYAENVDDRDFIMWHDDGSNADYSPDVKKHCAIVINSSLQSLRETSKHMPEPTCRDSFRECLLNIKIMSLQLTHGDVDSVTSLTFGKDQLPGILGFGCELDPVYQVSFPATAEFSQVITFAPLNGTSREDIPVEAMQAMLDTIELDVPYEGYPLNAPPLTKIKLEDTAAVAKVLYNISAKPALLFSQLQYDLNHGLSINEFTTQKHDYEKQLNKMVKNTIALMKKISANNADNPLLLTLYQELPNALNYCTEITMQWKPNANAIVSWSINFHSQYATADDILDAMRTPEVEALLAAGVTAPPLDENEEDDGDEAAEDATAAPQAESDSAPTPVPADEDDDPDEDDADDDSKSENDNVTPAAPVTPDDVAKTLSDANALLVRSYLSLAEASISANNNVDAENYADKVIEKDPTNARAWFLKGKVAVWQTNRLRNRIKEGFDAWGNAMQYADEAEKTQLAAQIKEEAADVLTCLLMMYCDSFKNNPTKDEARMLELRPIYIESDARRLKEKTGIEVCNADFRTRMARRLNICVVSVSNAADKEFGTDKSEMTKSAWERHTQVSDSCMDLLEKAYDLSSDEELCRMICNNAILIERETRDSCCYTYSNGDYVRDYTFTDKAIALRNDIIQKWTDRKAQHDPDTKKQHHEQVLAACAEKRSQLRRAAAYDQYWASHADEKTALEEERTRITAERADIKDKIDKGFFLKEAHDLDDEIVNAQLALEKLGFFKMREKRELEAKIEDLQKQRETASAKGFETERGFIDRNKEIDARLKAIEDEFAAPRGECTPVPKATLAPFDGSTTPMQLADYLRTVLPEGCGVQGEGEDAFINLTQKDTEELNRLIAGDDETPKPYVEDPDELKKYAVLLLDSRKATSVEVRFESKGLAQPIDDSLELALVAKFDPETVTDYIRMVESILQGICPSLDPAALADTLADCAYQTQEEKLLTADGLELAAEHPLKKELTLTVMEEDE